MVCSSAPAHLIPLCSVALSVLDAQRKKVKSLTHEKKVKGEVRAGGGRMNSSSTSTHRKSLVGGPICDKMLSWRCKPDSFIDINKHPTTASAGFVLLKLTGSEHVICRLHMLHTLVSLGV